MTRLVLDCSVTLAWLFKDERTPALVAVRDRVAREGAAVPLLWWLEVANALWTAERRGRIDRDGRMARFAVLGSLPVTTDDQVVVRAWTDVALVAERHRLTVYDATYLELALRLGLALCTTDHQLRAAAEDSGVAVHP